MILRKMILEVIYEVDLLKWTLIDYPACSQEIFVISTFSLIVITRFWFVTANNCFLFKHPFLHARVRKKILMNLLRFWQSDVLVFGLIILVFGSVLPPSISTMVFSYANSLPICLMRQSVPRQKRTAGSIWNKRLYRQHFKLIYQPS